MIPLSITLKGIYSYREEQTIDFTHLTEASIFGIFGSVGSGKSTILDAIFFALYGEIKRLNSRDNRNYNMMNLKSDELLIDFIFKTGEDDCEYRAVVSGKRNSKNFEKVNTYDRTAYKKINREWNPIDINSIEAIIGLSYENFSRTVIIPQNCFQEFLQLGDKERTQMMKELFHLEKFELDEKVKVLERRNDESKIGVENRLAQIGEISPEEIESKEEQFKGFNKIITENTLLLDEKNKKELKYKNLKTLFDKIDAQKKAIADLEKNEPQIQKNEEQLKKYEHCLLNFKNDFNNKKNLVAGITKQKSEIDTQKQTLNQTQQQLLKEEKEFELIKEDYKNREQLKKKSDELEKTIRIIQLEIEKTNLTAQLKAEEESHKTISAKIQQLTEDLISQKEILTKLKKSVPDVVKLSAIKDWFTVKGNLLGNIGEFQKDKKTSDKKIKSISATLKKIFTPSVKKILSEVSDYTNTPAVINSLQQVKVALKRKIKEIDNELQHLSAKNQLKKYADALKSGDPCTLCGSTEHPTPLNISDVKKMIKKAETNKEECENSIEIIDDTIQELKTSAKELETLQKNLLQVIKKTNNEENKLKKHFKKFRWKDFDKDDEGGLKNAFSEAERLKKQTGAIETAITTLEKEINKNNRLKEDSNDKKNSINRELSGKVATVETLKSELKNLKFNDYKNKTKETIRQEIAVLNQQYLSIERKYLTLEKSIKDLKQNENLLKGNLETGERRLSADKKSLTDLEAKILHQLRKSGFNSEEEIETILKLNLNIESEKKKIETFRQNLHTARTQLQKLSEETKDKSYDEQAHIKIKEEIEEIGKNLDKLKNERGALANQIQQLKENLKTRLELQKKLEEINLRGEDINTLKQLFKASGFVNYVSSVYLQNLCNAANERFYKLTQQKLRLEITDNNNFQVRDFMNGGHVRIVKTLSGGQTFQAALSLALALADNIQKLTKSNQNFFFLDEGFGSLDKEPLYIVFDTLKTLRKENRIVGVISHLEEMQQEIDTYLKITNTEEEGSIVTTSWSN